jgi:very-short-patch-repair endonuclease
VAAGHLHRVFAGVYALGNPELSDTGRYWAAILASGPDAVLSHRTAGELWQLIPTKSRILHTTTTHRGRGHHDQVRVHRTRRLRPAERTRRHGIPITTVARTLLDTRSELERVFIPFCDQNGLPAPTINSQIAGFEVDAAWEAERVAIELDGYAFHHGRRAFERDRSKALTLQAAGYRVLRLTWRQLSDEPGAVLAAIHAARTGGPAVPRDGAGR